ncbi:hypothetical protein [Acidithiobacillus thiooxidans]|uniref:hypothetical protein n=1 Tax=Acidithiobacillus thiooxidans TaxID=930 RepID=UPI00111294A4|nr:hypothetical protein [Acidithiobacillus thiooxidans]
MARIFEAGRAYIRRDNRCSGVLTLTSETSLLVDTFPLWDPLFGLAYSLTGRYLGDEEDSDLDLIQDYLFPEDLKVIETEPIWG